MRELKDRKKYEDIKLLCVSGLQHPGKVATRKGLISHMSSCYAHIKCLLKSEPACAAFRCVGTAEHIIGCAEIITNSEPT